jgi:aminopeptidase N
MASAQVETVHHELDLRLDPSRRMLQAVDRIDLNGAGGAEIRLAQSFRPERATIDGQILPAPHAQDGHWLWRLQLRPGSMQRLELHYDGVLHPLVEADHRGTLEGLPPMSDARGTYLPAGTGWYPTVAGAAFSYRVTLQLPPGQRGLVPGRLEHEQDGAQGYRATFAFPHPAEGIELMAGPYVVRERMLEREGKASIRLRTWFHPEIAELAPGYLDAPDAYLDLYEGWIGAYPFSEFSVVSSPLPTGFGMPTLTYLGVEVLRLPFIRATSLGHEVLHNWWGNGVYVDYARGNWAEGLTTFMADYTYRERENPAAAREMRQSWLRDFAAIPPGEDMPLRGFTSRTHGTSQIVGYHKAAFLFLMLRDRLGPQRFDAGLRQLWGSQQFRRASWADLQRSFEAAAGERLDAFFEQWLERRGAPDVRVESARAEPAGGRHRVHVTLVQAAPAYALSLPLALHTAAGTELRTVQMTQLRETVVIESASAPESVRLDPDLRVLRRLEARELPPILRQVMLDAATRVQLALEPAQRETGLALARALLDHSPDTGPPDANAPRLVIGLHEAVDRALASAGLPPRPETLAGRGSAQVWTGYSETGRALAVISARDVAALQALMRPLPHYGRQSWLVFDGARAIDRGVWPVEAASVPVTSR